MRAVVPKKSLKGILLWSQRVFFVCGVAMLGYCAFVLVDSYLYQQRESRMLEQALKGKKAGGRELPHVNLPPPPGVPSAAAVNGLIGRMEIPRLGLSVMVNEGADGTTLRRGAGHIPGTALPGQGGNVGISAHRDTFFRPLRNIRVDDVITLATLEGEYQYRVVSTKVVRPTEVAVLASNGSDVLTLVTCYPFYYVGSAPNRFIVRAERVTRLAGFETAGR